jgi:hypothetical protein
MINILAIPERLEQTVGEAQRHDVLDRFLAEEMIDPVDLLLPQNLEDLGIERLGRGNVMAEGLFDHHPAPLAMLFCHQRGSTEPGDRHAEEAVGDGEVEETVARSARCLVQLREMLAQPAVAPGIVQVALQIAHAVGEPSPCGLVDMVGLELTATLSDEFVHHVRQALSPVLRGRVGQVYADQPEFLGQLLGVDQVVERRHDQALGQVACGGRSPWRRAAPPRHCHPPRHRRSR